MSKRRASVTGVPVLLARCENVNDRTDERCGGLLAFQSDDLQAACSRCQAWCGRQVADYIASIRVVL